VFIILDYTCIAHAFWGLWYNHSPFHSAKLWVGKNGCPSTMEGAGFVYKKYLCRDHTLPTDLPPSEQSGSSLAVEVSQQGSNACLFLIHDNDLCPNH